MNRIDLFLRNDEDRYYKNTEHEEELLKKFKELFNRAESAADRDPNRSPGNLDKWRKAYLGTLGALDQDGNESSVKGRMLRRMIFELVESKVDNQVPMPKMQARYKTDLPLVDVTENYLKFEVDRILTRYENDRSERATYVDGTGWYKVEWDSLDNTHERSGNIKIVFRSVDQIYPQPNVTDYRQLEYIFERQIVSVGRLYDMYNRLIGPTDADTVEIISCYYINDKGEVGLFSWSRSTSQVICDEESWQIRKIRCCKKCDTINPIQEVCAFCGYDKFEYREAEEEILEEDLERIYNPYDVDETDDETEKDHFKTEVFLKKGETVPFYKVRQLPFVPRPAISNLNSIYGISEAFIDLEDQDAVNKLLSKALDKTLKSGAVVTKPEKMRIDDTNETFKIFGVKSAEEAQMVQAKQIMADTSGDIMMYNLLYDSGKVTSGVTESYQGLRDTTATSGKAKQFAAAQTAGRIESLRVMKAAAFAGVYELVLKYLLAFSDETRRFVKKLPDGSEVEEMWNKHMFLDKDKYGQVYYRDDFSFDTDPASTLSQSRVQMWQETQDKLVMGAFGVPNESRTLELFWNVMDSLQYPLAKLALAGIKDNAQHLPDEVEQAIMNNPQLMQIIAQTLTSSEDGRGGARPNSGPQGNGATHATNVERTNERNRADNRQTISGSQGGTA